MKVVNFIKETFISHGTKLNPMRERAILFWLVGAVCIFFGTLILTSIAPSPIEFSTLLGWVLSFVLVAVGGMFWISVMHMEEA